MKYLVLILILFLAFESGKNRASGQTERLPIKPQKSRYTERDPFYSGLVLIRKDQLNVYGIASYKVTNKKARPSKK